MPEITFFSLPVELRLQIASHAIKEAPNYASLRQWHRSFPELHIESRSERRNLSVLLVCKQFRHDFTSLVYRRTRWAVATDLATAISRLPSERLRDLRKLVISFRWSEMLLWQSFPFNQPSVSLEELCVPQGPAALVPEITSFLRRLRNVKILRFMTLLGDGSGSYFTPQLLGYVLKEDHYQRYDASDAPNLEITWWRWEVWADGFPLTLYAQKPKPVTDESEYLELMKPQIDTVMALHQRYAFEGEAQGTGTSGYRGVLQRFMSHMRFRW